jgi:hypothetical protein
VLKKREGKYNMKIANSIEKMKRNYRHMVFFDGMAKDVKTQI